MNGIFVTGTDTDVGKTVVSAAFMRALRVKQDVCYWKPIQTGIESANDTKTVNDLARCTEEEICDHGVRLEGPWSPHLSARLAGVTISVKKTLDFIDEYRGDRFWIIEGAGGPLVPLGDDEMMIDLMAALHLPIIVVARSTLGTINHTLLSLEAIRNRGLNVAGVVMNGEPNGPNREAIEHFGDVKVIAEIPPFENPLGDSLRVWTSKNSAALQIFGEQSRF